MTQEQMENTIQFLVDNQARFHTDMELQKESIQSLTESQKRTDAQIQSLTERVDVVALAVDSRRGEMREGFNNLSVANEVTRDLATKIGELTMQHAQRVTKLEEGNGKKG